MATKPNPFVLPTLAGNQYGGGRDDLNPTRNRPNPTRPANNEPQPWGVNNRVRPNPMQAGGNTNLNGGMGGVGTLLNPTLAQGGGRFYQPSPVNSTAGYAYTPRQFEADANVNTNSAFYKQNMNGYTPSDPEGQKIWAAMPVQTRLELSSWARAGAGAYTDALLQAQAIGPSGVIFEGQYMSGDQLVKIITDRARQYMGQIDQARTQGKEAAQMDTPYRLTVGA